MTGQRIALPDDHESVAGMSDEAVRKATGRDWAEWARVLDEVGAASMSHKEIAAWVDDNHEDVSGWWAQSVTVAYERFRGLRDVGQRRDGGYEVSKSKTVEVSVEDLWSAFADAATRAKWLGIEVEVRTATKPKSMRMTLDDGTPLDAYFTDKGGAKSSVSVQNRKLADRETADERKDVWGERLAALKELLEG